MSDLSKKLTRQTFRLYWSFVTRHKGYLAACLVSIPLSILTFRFLPPIFIARILENMSAGRFVTGDLWGSFGHDLAWYIGAIVLGGVIMWRVAVFFIWQLEMRVTQDIHRHIFRHLMSMDSGFHANRFGGSMVSQTNKFAGAYVRLQDTTAFQTIGTIVSLIFSAAILYGRAPWVALFLVVYSLLFAVIAVKITSHIRELRTREAAASNRQTGFLADAITNIMAVKSFAGSAYERLRYKRATQAVRDTTHQLMWASLKKDAVFSVSITGMSIAALLIALVGAVYFEANVGTVFLVVTYASIINQNLWDFSQSTLSNINRALGDAKDMTEILQLKPKVKDPTKPLPVTISRGDIRFEGIDFRYPDAANDDHLFKDLDLHIKPGEKVGLVGHSGGGKTTVTKLLLRFMDIQKGVIRIDGHDIAAMSQDDLRRGISYVPQEPLLFHRSLAKNIAYADPEASRQQIEAVAKMAHAHEFITGLSDGYDTLVGERGVKLSGGQRQRVVIARAMLKNAPILILDEATSALDSESETLIQDALWKLMQNRTAIIIAHRLSTIQKMDRIIVMNEGSIAEEGTHRELIRKNGAYANLWRHQSGGFLEE
jgi:ATP-binding cassette, subfamily B, bacterial